MIRELLLLFEVDPPEAAEWYSRLSSEKKNRAQFSGQCQPPALYLLFL